MKLLQTSLRTVLFVLDEARVMLDTFTSFPGKSSVEAAATAALKLLQTSLRLSDSFISSGRTAGAGSEPQDRQARPHAQCGQVCPLWLLAPPGQAVSRSHHQSCGSLSSSPGSSAGNSHS